MHTSIKSFVRFPWWIKEKPRNSKKLSENRCYWEIYFNVSRNSWYVLNIESQNRVEKREIRKCAMYMQRRQQPPAEEMLNWTSESREVLHYTDLCLGLAKPAIKAHSAILCVRLWSCVVYCGAFDMKESVLRTCARPAVHTTNESITKTHSNRTRA